VFGGIGMSTSYATSGARLTAPGYGLLRRHTGIHPGIPLWIRPIDRSDQKWFYSRLRCCREILAPRKTGPCSQMVQVLTARLDAICPRYLLGNICCNRAAGLHQVLCATIQRQTLGSYCMLLFHGPRRNLVYLVAGQMDYYMPVGQQVLPSEQESLHHHRVTARLLQRRHPSSTNTCYVRRTFLLGG
jgi:hypothetical protein